MRQIDPVALEDVLHLQFEQVGVGEDVAAAPEDAGFLVVFDGIGQQVLQGSMLVDDLGHGFSPAPEGRLAPAVATMSMDWDEGWSGLHRTTWGSGGSARAQGIHLVVDAVDEGRQLDVEDDLGKRPA